jgi:hypothetical protein
MGGREISLVRGGGSTPTSGRGWMSTGGTGADDWRRLNVEGIWSRLDTGSAGRNCDWRRRPDIRLARRHVGPQWLVSRLRIELRVCARRYGPLRRAAPPQTHRQIGEPNTESEPSTIERAAAEPEHGTGQPDACDPEAFLAPLFGRCVHISQNVAGD